MEEILAAIGAIVTIASFLALLAKSWKWLNLRLKRLWRWARNLRPPWRRDRPRTMEFPPDPRRRKV